MWDYALSGMLLGLATGYILGYMKGSSSQETVKRKKKIIHVGEESKIPDSKKYPLSRDEEFKIINSFKKLESMNYYDAVQVAQLSGYNIRPLYLNYDTSKLTDSDFNLKVLGVRVNEYPITPESKVLEIIDVGGIDQYKRGNLFL